MARKDAIINLRDVLIRRREALRRALTGDLSLLNELREQSSGDVVDFALDSVQDEINSQLAEVESRELGHIDTALQRMREGSYGKCEGCGSNIPLARLQALPYATCCINCQRELERNGGNRQDVPNWGNLLDTNAGDSDPTLADIEMDVS